MKWFHTFWIQQPKIKRQSNSVSITNTRVTGYNSFKLKVFVFYTLLTVCTLCIISYATHIELWSSHAAARIIMQIYIIIIYFFFFFWSIQIHAYMTKMSSWCRAKPIRQNESLVHVHQCDTYFVGSHIWPCFLMVCEVQISLHVGPIGTQCRRTAKYRPASFPIATHALVAISSR